MKKNKKTKDRPSDSPEIDDSADVDTQADRSPKVHSAADAVQRAEEELAKARTKYNKIRGEAIQRLQTAREKTVGDLIDGTLGLVKRFPGPGVILAVLAGFFLGRLFRK